MGESVRRQYNSGTEKPYVLIVTDIRLSNYTGSSHRFALTSLNEGSTLSKPDS